MLEPLDIIGHLRDKEFDEHELLILLGQMIKDQRTDSADRAILQYTESLSAFKDRRLRRLVSEFRNIILTDINEEENITDVSKTKLYTCKFEDINGKRHTVKFELPLIDNKGHCLVD